VRGSDDGGGWRGVWRATYIGVIARLDRATQYAVASRFISAVSGILDRPVKPGDDSGGWRGTTGI